MSRRAFEAYDLRASGLLWREVAEKLGVGTDRAQQLAYKGARLRAKTPRELLALQNALRTSHNQIRPPKEWEHTVVIDLTRELSPKALEDLRRLDRRLRLSTPP